MSDSNKIKIQSILSDLFNKHRFIFWYDEDGTMEELVTGMDIEGVEILTLDHNAFSLKYRIQTGKQSERGFLIYSKESEPELASNWLLDFQMEGMKFSADMASLYATECNIPLELKSRIVDEHIEFFKDEKNRAKLANSLKEDSLYTVRSRNRNLQATGFLTSRWRV